MCVECIVNLQGFFFLWNLSTVCSCIANDLLLGLDDPATLTLLFQFYMLLTEILASAEICLKENWTMYVSLNLCMYFLCKCRSPMFWTGERYVFIKSSSGSLFSL